MMLLKRFLLCWLFFTTIALSGQYTKEFKRIFFDASYLYETGFYEEAFNRYKNLLTLDPGNSNILFLCGACCLNIPGSETHAITYLKEAATGVTPAYKDNSHTESGSPVIAYFMLGRAYHLHNEFENAIANYKIYLEEGKNEDPLQLDYTRLQIEACSRAELLLANPPSFEFQSVLDQFDDDLPSCNNPVISGDGDILIFLVDYPSDKKIMMTTRTGKLWSRPSVINSEIGMVGETYPVSLSYDGKELYLVHQFYSHSDLFVSRFEGGRWLQATALGQNINGRTSETHASISKDGNTLYFTSDARGGIGSFDIYVSKKDDKGTWGVPVNLGPTINTAFEEHTPFISGNDSILFFSSQGHASVGGNDVFYTEVGPDGAWSEPVSLGSPVNTTGEDLFFNPGWNELDGVYAVRKEDDPTSNTINMVIELEPVAQAPVDEPADSAVEEVIAATVPEVQEELATVEKAIEPPETDEIEEVLNRQAVEPAPISEFVADPVQPPLANKELQAIIPFEHNGCNLNMAALLEVEKIAGIMIEFEDTRLELTGHTDATGSAEYNMLLSVQRADQVAQYLELRGINKDRIVVNGRGEAAPVARNHYPDGKDAPLGRYLNRQALATITGRVPPQSILTKPYVPSSLRYTDRSAEESPLASYWFTIQLRASYEPLGPSYFKGLTDVEEYICKDQYYRYTRGSFRSFQEAKEQLLKLKRMGFEDAFIQAIDWYTRAAK